jgi:hypothetical protein
MKLIRKRTEAALKITHANAILRASSGISLPFILVTAKLQPNLKGFELEKGDDVFKKKYSLK